VGYTLAQLEHIGQIPIGFDDNTGQAIYANTKAQNKLKSGQKFAPWELLQKDAKKWAKFQVLIGQVDWNSLTPFAKWDWLSKAGYKWGTVAKDCYWQTEAFYQRLLDSNASQKQIWEAANAFVATLPRQPKTGLQALANQVMPLAIKSIASSIVAGGIASAASGIVTNVGTNLVGEDGMSFIDDIGKTFDQVSSLESKAKAIVSQAKNFGNSGATASGPPAPQMQGPSVPGTGIPSWVWIVGGIAVAYLIFRK
jgi:hypothetical protein